jgi:hypothetical protein
MLRKKKLIELLVSYRALDYKTNGNILVLIVKREILFKNSDDNNDDNKEKMGNKRTKKIHRLTCICIRAHLYSNKL